MRRIAALLIVPFLAVAAGCTVDDTPATGTGTGAPTPAVGGASAAAPGATPASVDPSVAAAGDKALAGNTKAICDQAARAGTSFGETFIADLKLQIDAAHQGAAAKSQAQEKIDRDVSSYSSALAGMAKLSGDATLKATLTDMSKQVNALKGDITKINPEQISAITARLDHACGKG
jgi:hypothetical protein